MTKDDDEESLQQSAVSLRSQVRALRKLVIALISLTVFLMIIGGALGQQVHTRNEIIEDTQANVEETRATVIDIKSYVDELRKPPTREQLEQQQAITVAVRLVPSIKGILCEKFPEASGCQN